MRHMHFTPLRRTSQWSLARQLLVIQVVIVGVLVAGGAVLVYFDVGARARQTSAQTVTTLSRAIADTPFVISAVTGPDPTAQLQPYTETVRGHTGVDFITIM